MNRRGEWTSCATLLFRIILFAPLSARRLLHPLRGQGERKKEYLSIPRNGRR